MVVKKLEKDSSTENDRDTSVFNINVYNNISKTGLDLFKNTNYFVDEKDSDPDAILVRSQKLHDLELNTSLKAIGRAGAGVNNVPIQKCTDNNIVVFNTPGANANAVKELVFGAMILTSRRLFKSIKFVKALSDFDGDLNSHVEASKKKFKGYEINGKKLTVVGLGAIGVMIANDSKSLGLSVDGFDPFISVENAWGLSNKINKSLDLNNSLSNSDFVSVHMPLTEKTKGFFNKESIAKMKTGSVLINFSRAEIVNEDDVIDALVNGKLSYYITDFPTKRLIELDNAICIPHLGASTIEAEENCAKMIVHQIKDFLIDGNIKNSVNFPNCYLERKSENRLIVINENIPKVVSEITAILADNNINISEMINKSKDSIAYNILDIDKSLSEQQLTALRGINGVRTVRLI